MGGGVREASVLILDGASTVFWLTAVLLAALGADRLLLVLERRGWIFYRKTKGIRGRAMYYAQELDSVFNPGMKHVQEAHVQEEEAEDRSGDPPVSDPDDEGGR